MSRATRFCCIGVTVLKRIAVIMLVSPALFAAAGQDGVVELIIADDPATRLRLEARHAPLAGVLATVSAKTGVPIHYSVLPEGLVTATCVGATVKQLVGCLLARKADLIVRNRQPAKALKVPEAAEMWVLGTRYTAMADCAGGIMPLQSASKPDGRMQENPVDTVGLEQTEDLLAQAKSKDAKVRASAIGALMSIGRAGDVRVKNILEAALTDPNADVRAQAISSLAHREGSAATAALQNALHDSDAGVRLMAVEGIGDDLALLQQAINDDDETVRQLALSKLQASQKKLSP